MRTLWRYDYAPRACELMDHNILECTKANLEQRQNRFFVQGDPGAILAVELAAPTREVVAAVAPDLKPNYVLPALVIIIRSSGARTKTAYGTCAKPHWVCFRTYRETPNLWPS